MNDVEHGTSAAGYRLVRRLGSGTRADVFLGHHAGIGVERPGESPGGATSAAIKVYRSTTARSSIDAEIGALARASSPRLVRLDDLSTAPSGRPVLVLGLLRPQSLAHALVTRGRIGAAEAATLLAPIATAVAELHRVGVAHGQVTAGSVLFDEHGAPVLASFGRAVVIGAEPEGASDPSLTPAAFAEAEPALRDLADLALLVGAVVESSPPAVARTRILAWLRSTDLSGSPERFASELARVLIDAALPGPTLPRPAVARPVVPNRAVSSTLGPSRPRSSGPITSGAMARPTMPGRRVQPPAPSAGPVRGRRRARGSRLDAIRLPDWLVGGIRSSVSPASSMSPVSSRASRSSARPRPDGARLRRVLGPVRRPVWIAAVASAVLLVGAVVLVPGGDASPGHPEAPPSAGPAPPDAGPAPPNAELAAPEQWRAAIAGDDPVAAALALLRLRDECVRALSVLCLDGVDQVGSAAWEADGYLIREAQEGGGAGASARPVPRTDPGLNPTLMLVERIGNSALVTSHLQAQGAPAPTSMLLIKGSDGWRIRDLFIG